MNASSCGRVWGGVVFFMDFYRKGFWEWDGVGVENCVLNSFVQRVVS